MKSVTQQGSESGCEASPAVLLVKHHWTGDQRPFPIEAPPRGQARSYRNGVVRNQPYHIRLMIPMATCIELDMIPTIIQPHLFF